MRCDAATTMLSAEVPQQFVRYVVIGIFGTLLDLFLFWLLLRCHWWPSIAVTFAFSVATAVQFSFNRNWSFRSFHRPIAVQAGVYAAVTIANWIVAFSFVELGTHVWHIHPLLAKTLSIPPVAVLGFLANRHLTFGPVDAPHR